MQLVLFFTHGVSLQTWDSVGSLVREVAIYERLVKTGVDVEFVTYGNRLENQIGKRIADIRVVCNHMGLPLRLYEELLTWNPPKGDIFKSNQVLGANIALAAARRRGAKFIARCGYLLSQNQESDHGAGSTEAGHARDLENKVFMGADRIVVTTQTMSTAIQELYSLPVDRIRVIPNYVETERFRPIKVHANQRPRIGFVGRLSVEKNLFALIDAVSGLDAELCIVGDGLQKNLLQEYATSKRANVNFLGTVPNLDLPSFLNTCDLFVLPSLYEGHPKALLEAMACGLPVIGPDVRGIRELILHGENGFLCEIDANSIRESIQYVLEDENLRQRVGAQARRFVEDKFSLDKILQLELALLNELAA